MLKLIHKKTGEEYGNLYDKVEMYYTGLNFYVGDEIIVQIDHSDYPNGVKTVICTVVNTPSCKAMGIGDIAPYERFVGFKRRASALKLGEIVGNGNLIVVDK